MGAPQREINQRHGGAYAYKLETERRVMIRDVTRVLGLIRNAPQDIKRGAATGEGKNEEKQRADRTREGKVERDRGKRREGRAEGTYTEDRGTGCRREEKRMLSVMQYVRAQCFLFNPPIASAFASGRRVLFLRAISYGTLRNQDLYSHLNTSSSPGLCTPTTHSNQGKDG